MSGAHSDALMANWRATQGARAARGIPEMMRALETIAKPIADAAASDEAFIALTKDQMTVACQCALSQERYKRHGKPPRSPREWWGQINAIATEWKLQITPEWWGEETATAIAFEKEAA